jgi:hypothetical protein
MTYYYPVISDVPVVNKVIPLIKNIRATTVFKAFVLAAILQTILLSLTLSTKDLVDKFKINPFWNYIISIVYIFLITVITYTIMYILFDYGGGMLVQ